MVLFETALSLHSSMCQDLVRITSDTDKLGTMGTSLYLCHDYTSGLHQDNDAFRGLCAQIDLTADSNLREYGFIYAAYGLYVVPQANSLW